ncbi:hypothetical protein Taro_053499, partial [Colocasia esculenta]|nr:hypothetical protein [Colocasia esculenta]
ENFRNWVFGVLGSTLDILGRDSGSLRRQREAAWATAFSWSAKRRVCSWSRRGSSSRSTAMVRSPSDASASTGLAHSARNCCPLGCLMSMALRPVTSSSSTTPNAYTSAFSVITPLSMYSGARLCSCCVRCFYPKLATTRVSTPFPSTCHLARPKSPTCSIS